VVLDLVRLIEVLDVAVDLTVSPNRRHPLVFYREVRALVCCNSFNNRKKILFIFNEINIVSMFVSLRTKNVATEATVESGVEPNV